MKIGTGDDAEYYNDKKFKSMTLGYSSGLILFDVSSVELVYVATAKSAETVELFDYKLGFYRMPFKSIGNLLHLTKVAATTIVVQWIVFIAVGILITCGIFMYIREKRRDSKESYELVKMGD